MWSEAWMDACIRKEYPKYHKLLITFLWIILITALSIHLVILEAKVRHTQERESNDGDIETFEKAWSREHESPCGTGD